MRSRGKQEEQHELNIHSDGFYINYLPSGRDSGVIMHSSVKNISSTAVTMQVWHVTGRKKKKGQKRKYLGHYINSGHPVK